MMSSVAFQYGRNTTYCIESLNTGVLRSSNSAPTMTFISITFFASSYASSRNAGTFTNTYLSPSTRGIQR